MAYPVSWLLIEPGWQVVDASGGDIGRIEADTGDSNADIFDGIAVATGMLARPKYIPAEQVGAITEGTVHLTLERSALQQEHDGQNGDGRFPSTLHDPAAAPRRLEKRPHIRSKRGIARSRNPGDDVRPRAGAVTQGENGCRRCVESHPAGARHEYGATPRCRPQESVCRGEPDLRPR